MSTPTDVRPDFVYAAPGPDGPSAPPPGSTPVPTPGARPRRRVAALLLAGAVACTSAGAATATLLDDDGAAAASSPVVTRAAAAPASATTSGTPASAAAAISPSVVTITTTVAGAMGQTGTGTGSGIVFDDADHVVTNAHVVAGATPGSIRVTLQDGRSGAATVVGSDTSSDLAVLSVSGLDDLVPAVFADSSTLRVGQAVLAVGAPLGLSNTVTQGIVSTLDRPVRTGGEASADGAPTESSVIDAVQTDAAINPGNSGGALVDLAGQVVGIPSAIATAPNGSSGNIGVGFAIPSDDAVEVAQELIADGTADHPLLGVSVADATSSTATAGATLAGVTAGGAADQAGLQAGDVVTAVDDRRVTDADSLIVAVRDHEPGDTVTVHYTRDGETRTATAELTAQTS